MGTVEENRQHWTHYDWSHEGHEWSQTWGGTEALWWATLWPRLRRFLPAGDVLEIAPGFGRVTEYLLPLSRRLSLVDVTARCIEHCRSKFARWDHVSYHVNDGRSLADLADSSIDFALSFDSLVHAELDVVESYVRELARVLRPGAAAFLHHSNFADAIAAAGPGLRNDHWRAESVGADAVVAAARASGLDCAVQERVAWGGEILNDCFSVVVRRAPAAELERREHRAFMQEAYLANELSSLLARFDDWPLRRREATTRSHDIDPPGKAP